MFRFAPSPTGDMQLEDLRVALYNFICAKQKGDRFIIRIGDIDKAKNIEGKDKEILDLLDIFGITYDEVYRQSSNFKYHLQFASTLLDEKKAFICFCTEKELEKKRKVAKKTKVAYKYDGTCENLESEEILESTKPFVIRIKKPTQSISFDDTIKGNLTFENSSIDSFVIMYVDKYPTYDFACAIDDMLQGTTHIIRGENYLSSTPKQEHIRKALGYDEKIKYTHLPDILINPKPKTNKTDDKYCVRTLLNKGYMPEAIINYLIGLDNKTPKEIFTLDEALKWFDINNISESTTQFDIGKLRFLNKKHIKLLGNQ